MKPISKPHNLSAKEDDVCEHRSVEVQIGMTPGSMVIHIKCRDCGLPPLLEAMDILALEALMMHSQQQMVVDGQIHPGSNVKLN